MLNIKMTVFQRSNLLQFLNRVELKGIDEATAFMEVINIIQNSEEDAEKIPQKPAD